MARRVDYYPMKRVIEKFGNKFILPLIRNKTRKCFDVQIQNLDNLPETSGIIAPNHCVSVDGIIIKSNLGYESKRLFHFWIQDEGVYSRTWKRKAFLWSMGEIPVKVDARSSNKAVLKRTYEHTSRDNDIIGIFPEGPAKDLIDTEGKVIPLEERVHFTGPANIAVKAEVPIIPIGITSSEEVERLTWDKRTDAETAGKNFTKQYVAENGKIPYRINIGKPIHPAQYNHLNRKEARYELTEAVKKGMINLIYKNRSDMW